MTKKEKIFIGVAWPYTNGPVHIGHLAGAYLVCDYFARYHRLKGNDVLMVTGSDMHGTPTTVMAEKEGVEPIVVANRYHQQDKKIFKQLGVTFDIYTKTSTKNHRQVAQSIFLDLVNKGHIFKKTAEQLYCQKCKRFLPDRYVEGECPHCHFKNARGDQCDDCGKTLDSKELISPICKICGATPVIRKTEHFFLDLPQFEKQLKTWISKQKHWRKHVREFALGWLREGLKARAVTRDMSYGVPVPVKGFENKVIYVWFEAVIGYLSAAIEWAKRKNQLEAWKNYWHDPKCKHYYFIGKDNIPFHTIIWPAILLGYDKKLQLPYDIPANNFLLLEGKPFSKSRGWYIDAQEMLNRYSPDLIRYFFAANAPENKDVDFSWKFFVEKNNNELVATLGNFIYRTLTFTQRNFSARIPKGRLDPKVKSKIEKTFEKLELSIEACKFQQAIAEIFALAQFANKYFDEQSPWKSIKEEKKKAANAIYNCLHLINALKILFYPFMPFAAEKLHQALGLSGTIEKNEEWKFTQLPIGQKLAKPKVLFKKIDPSVIEKELERLKAKNEKQEN